MANNNPADNLSDADRSRGGKNTPSQFGGPQGADPSEAGKKGAQAQPRAAKAEGGRRSSRS